VTNSNKENTMTTATAIPQPRMKNPGMVIPEATNAIKALVGATMQGDVPQATLGLVHLRASQINGCSFCVDSGSKHAKQGGETDERLFGVAAWRESPYFTDAERAALALAESVTRLSDRADPVPDAIWDEAARHYNERQLAVLVLWIATTNVFNRVNVATRQPAGTGGY
jgi:AhpD family alkylhydroperoxidase